jgi:hypothetical protein
MALPLHSPQIALSERPGLSQDFGTPSFLPAAATFASGASAVIPSTLRPASTRYPPAKRAAAGTRSSNFPSCDEF